MSLLLGLAIALSVFAALLLVRSALGHCFGDETVQFMPGVGGMETAT